MKNISLSNVSITLSIIMRTILLPTSVAQPFIVEYKYWLFFTYFFSTFHAFMSHILKKILLFILISISSYIGSFIIKEDPLFLPSDSKTIFPPCKSTISFEI